LKNFTHTPLEPLGIYHIFNRANGSDKLFANKGNYLYFLERYKTYIAPVADTFCYCLMPNHFHLLVRLKEEKELERFFRKKYAGRYETTFRKFQIETAFRKFQTFGKLVSKEFSNLFSSYAQAYNKQQRRKGNLFMHKFKRLLVQDDKYLLKLVHYIHLNPVTHGFCQKPGDWPYSSYGVLISDKPTWLKKTEVIEWFNDMNNFIYCHSQAPEFTGIDDLIP